MSGFGGETMNFPVYPYFSVEDISALYPKPTANGVFPYRPGQKRARKNRRRANAAVAKNAFNSK